MRLFCALVLITALSALAQTTGTGSRSTVSATGQASVSVTPDQAQIEISAVTQSSTAQDAASQNASLAAAIIAQVKKTLGASGTVQTVGYSVNPTYNNAGTLTGYIVTNSIEVILQDLTITGAVIDSATQSGATRINSLQFLLKDDSVPRSQALRAATLQAKAKADAMAASLSLKTGAIIAIQESGAVVPSFTSVPILSATVTPISPGQVSVQGNVTIAVELIQ